MYMKYMYWYVLCPGAVSQAKCCSVMHQQYGKPASTVWKAGLAVMKTPDKSIQMS
jgi:hypothetical protein